MTDDEILDGLAPGLIITLARLAGSTLGDLRVTMQLAPFGDRATLAAYDLLHHEKDRRVVVHPRLVEMTYAAVQRV